MKKDLGYRLPKIPKKKLSSQEHFTPHKLFHNITKDASGQNPLLDRLAARRLLEQKTEALKKKRITSESIKKKLDWEWKRLAEYESAFRHIVMDFSKFVEENRQKRSRAIMKLNHAKELAKERQAYIDGITHTLVSYTCISNTFKKEIAKHEIYETFLSLTVEHMDSAYRTINDFLNKFEELEFIKQWRCKEQITETNEIVYAHRNMIDLLHDRTVVTVGLRNELNDVRCKYDEVSRKNLATEVLIQDIVNRAHEYSVRVESCHFMIDAIYRYICQRRKVPIELLKSDIQAKIDCIKSTLGGWAKILTNTEPKTKKKKPKHKGKSFFTARNTTLPKESVVMWEKKTADPTKISDENDEETNQLS